MRATFLNLAVSSTGMARGGQFATEYLVVSAFMLMMLLGGVYFFWTNRPTSSTVHGQVQLMGTTLIDTASDLYFIGRPSKTTPQLIFPPGLTNVTVDPAAPQELIITYETNDGDFERIFLSRVNLAVNINYLGRGKRDVVLEAKEKAVSICVVDNLCNCDGICQRPAENYTVCAADCCASEQPGLGPGGRTCRACEGAVSKSPFTCITGSINYTKCDGHNGCSNCTIARGCE